MWASRVGGALAVAVSIGLTVHATGIRELNPTAAGVFALAAGAGVLAVVRPARVGALMTAALVLFVALIPAAFTRLWLLYLPAMVLIVAGLVRAARDEGRF